MTQPEHKPAPHHDSPSIDCNGGNVLCDFVCMESMLDAYDQAIRLVPNEPSFYHHKAHILEQLGRLAEAKRAYEQAERLGYNG
jgi:tetratricopeptide (TPR) repeat protein